MHRDLSSRFVKSLKAFFNRFHIALSRGRKKIKFYCFITLNRQTAIHEECMSSLPVLLSMINRFFSFPSSWYVNTALISLSSSKARIGPLRTTRGAPESDMKNSEKRPNVDGLTPPPSSPFPDDQQWSMNEWNRVRSYETIKIVPGITLADWIKTPLGEALSPAKTKHTFISHIKVVGEKNQDI